jgi:hypothetical protein
MTTISAFWLPGWPACRGGVMPTVLVVDDNSDIVRAVPAGPGKSRGGG